MPLPKEAFRTLYCDPGEDFGWCQGVGLRLISRGIEKMWTTVDEVGDDIELRSATIFSDPSSPYHLDDFEDHELLKLPVGRIVCEDFRIYPGKVRALAYNPVRTARAIGALTYIARRNGVEFVLQPASIKQAAVACGAEELFDHPLHENRHSNDAIMHFVFYTNSVLMGRNIKVPNQGVDDDPTKD